MTRSKKLYSEDLSAVKRPLSMQVLSAVVVIMGILYFDACIIFTDRSDGLPAHIHSIDSLLISAFEEDLFNGNVAVYYKGRHIFENSYGYTSGSLDQPLTGKSIFSSGSISKQFDAAGIMLLVDKGMIRLSDNLSKFELGLPEWAENISIRHLLNNSSGLPQLRFNQVRSEADLFRDLRNLADLESNPGSVFLYNHNIPVLLKRIIEVVTDDTYENFISSNFFDPLDLSSAVFDPTDDYPNLVRSYDQNNQNDKPYNPFTGWVYLTAKDLLKWTVAIHSGEVLTDSAYQVLTKNEFFPDQRAGLGRCQFQQNQLLKCHHFGGYFNFISLAYANMDKDVFVALMSNNGSRELYELAEKIENILDQPSK